jgi:hypothetical protein
MSRHPTCRVIPAILTLLAGLWLAGCGGNGTNLRLEGVLEEARVAPDFRLRAYVPRDQNSADVYLSDIPSERLLDPNDSLADAVGSIVHIHMFLTPSAGSTPIDATACNATVRQIVLAGKRGPEGKDPAIGVYGGGGFVLPDDDPGARQFSGDLFEATLKLTHATPGFVDRLGAARMHGSFAARRDDALAKGIGLRLDALVETAEARP